MDESRRIRSKMKRLLIFLKGYEKESFLAPLFKMLEATFELIVPLVVARIMDIGIKNQDNVYIWHQCVIMVLLGVIGLACSLTAQYFSAKAAMGFSTALRKELFSHISRLSYRELDMLGTPTLVTRITNDVNQAQTGVNMVLRLFLRSPFIVVGAVIMSFTIDVKIGLIFLIAVPVISIVIYGIMRTTVPIYKKAQSFLDRISLITRENHVGARVVRAFGRQQEEYKEFSEVNDDYTKVQVRAGKISALLNPATTVIMNFAIIGILWYGSKEVSVGILTQGEVVALVNYMNQILIALIALANLIVAVTKAMASGVRLNEVLDTQPSLTDQGNSVQKENAGAARVVFEDVSFTYAGSKEPALSHISFTAKPGETIGIIGGTGDLGAPQHLVGDAGVLISAPVGGDELDVLSGKIRGNSIAAADAEEMVIAVGAVRDQPLAAQVGIFAAQQGGAALNALARDRNAEDLGLHGAGVGLAVDGHVLHDGVFPVQSADVGADVGDVHIAEHQTGDGNFLKGLHEDAVFASAAGQVLDGNVLELRQIITITAHIVQHGGMDDGVADRFDLGVAQIDVLHSAAALCIGLEAQGVVQSGAVEGVVVCEQVLDAAAHLAAAGDAAVAVCEGVVADDEVLGGMTSFAQLTAIAVAAGLDGDAVVAGVEEAVLD